MNIKRNAIDSIAIGLEDFAMPDKRRLISCTRNIFAGILLLFKHKLSELSPPDSDEVLIKQKVSPSLINGILTWKGKGNKTINVQGIKEQFRSLGIQVDWERIDKINQIRNAMEHHYTELNHDTIRSFISKSFIIIRDFIETHIGEDPKELLGNTAWSVLLREHEVYEREKIECISRIQNLKYYNDEIMHAFTEYPCGKCGSDLISPSETSGDALESDFCCRSCGEVTSYEDAVKLAVENYYYHEVYLSYTDGSESPITDCPQCPGVYLYSEGVCSACGHNAEHTCLRCNSEIAPEELLTEPYCGYCDHVMSKDD